MDTLGARMPITALADVETFLNSAGHLKGLLHFRAERLQHKSNIERALGRMIRQHAQVCADLAKGNRRIAELWKLTQAELPELQECLQSTEPAA